MEHDRAPAADVAVHEGAEPASSGLHSPTPTPQLGAAIASAGRLGGSGGVAASSQRVQRSSGPVSGRTIQKMERSLGSDFSDVTFRSDPTLRGPFAPLGKVQRSTVSLNPSIDPNSSLGHQVIGHELAHVTQRAGRGTSSAIARERDAARRGALAAAGAPATEGAVGGGSPDEAEHFVPLAAFLGYVVADAVISEVKDHVMDELEREFQATVDSTVNEINDEVRATLNEASPTAVFLIEHGAAHVKTYQQVKQALATIAPLADDVADQLMKRIVEEQMKVRGEGAPSDAELRIFLGLVKQGSIGAVKIADVLARHAFTQLMGEYVATVDNAEALIATGAQWILDKADLAEEAAKLAEVGGAATSRLSAMKWIYKKATGKDTLGDKIAKGAETAREQATKLQETTAEAREKIDSVKELMVDSDLVVGERMSAKVWSNLGDAAMSSSLGAVASAKIAFEQARDEGLSAREMLDAAHAAGGKTFLIEMVGASLAEGGRMFIFKGIVYLIPGAGAVAEVVADVNSALFKVVYDVYGDTLQEHTKWALANVPALLSAGIGTAKAVVQAGVDTAKAAGTAAYDAGAAVYDAGATVVDAGTQAVETATEAATWAAQYVSDVATWAYWNPVEALLMGMKNTATAVVDAPKYAASAVQGGAKLAATGAGMALDATATGAGMAYDATAAGVGVAYDATAAGAGMVYDAAAAGTSAVVDGVVSGVGAMYQGTVDSIETAKTVARQAWELKGEIPKMVFDASVKMITTYAKDAALATAFKAAKLALAGTPGVNYAFLVAEAIAGFCVRHPDLAWFAYEYVQAVCEVTGLTAIARAVLMKIFIDEAGIDLSDRPTDGEDGDDGSTATASTAIPSGEQLHWQTVMTLRSPLGWASPMRLGGFGPMMSASAFAVRASPLPTSLAARVERLESTAEEIDLEIEEIVTAPTATETSGGPARPTTGLQGLGAHGWDRIRPRLSELGIGTSAVVAAIHDFDVDGEPTPRPLPMNAFSLPMVAGLPPHYRAMTGISSIDLTLRQMLATRPVAELELESETVSSKT